ncbi:MAG TPA: DUF1295 domain-containing protein, partial [Thermoanaerobaculia bacterium]|nr:DUF1295 domain-containing protein [Thermoanaerobaculia bacterium]
ISLLMAFIWWLSERIHNAGIVDICWSAWFSLLAILYAALSDGALSRRILIAVIVSIWSLRLALHLLRRVSKEHPKEDKRYTTLRQEWKPNDARKMLIFFQQQGISNVLLSIPFAIVALDRNPEINAITIAGVVVWCIGVLGESLADRQLSHFKHDPLNKGRTCQVGLWSWSRHPNYFFEWTIWCGFYWIACGSPWGWTTIYCPVGMLYLLLKVTGVPMAEEQSLASRGDEYRQYQKTTNKFFPGPRKQGGTA